MSLRLSQLPANMSGISYGIIGFLAAAIILRVVKSTKSPNVSIASCCQIFSMYTFFNSLMHFRLWAQVVAGWAPGGLLSSMRLMRRVSYERGMRKQVVCVGWPSGNNTRFTAQIHAIQGFGALLLDCHSEQPPIRGRIGQGIQ